MRAIGSSLHRALGYGLIEAWPAASGVELGTGGEKGLVAADTVVHAIFEVVSVFSSEGPLCGRLAGYPKGCGFGALALEQGFPFQVGFLYGIGHGVTTLGYSGTATDGDTASPIGRKVGEGFKLGVFIKWTLKYLEQLGHHREILGLCSLNGHFTQVVAQHILRVILEHQIGR
jgi:hypothetical protein